jgi:hypothetical protein
VADGGAVVSGYLIAEVWCDICLHREVADDECMMSEWRANLRDRGWVRRWINSELLDICPSCAEKEEES